MIYYYQRDSEKQNHLLLRVYPGCVQINKTGFSTEYIHFE